MINSLITDMKQEPILTGYIITMLISGILLMVSMSSIIDTYPDLYTGTVLCFLIMLPIFSGFLIKVINYEVQK